MEQNTVIAYAAVLLCNGFAFTILQIAIEKNNPFSPKMKAAYAKVKQKGIISILSYSSAIGMAFVNTYISCALIVFVAVLWIVPDKHFENALKADTHD
jgi:uncharacterized membrane protein